MTPKLALLMVGPLPPPSGGMANQTRQLVRLLDGEGVETQLVQTNAPYVPAWISGVRGIRAVFRLLPYLWRLRRASRRAHVIHVMANSGWAWFLLAWPAIQIGRWFRVPILVNYRGGLAREFLAQHGARVVTSLRQVSLVVVPSGFLREVFGGHGISSIVIPNIVDLELFRPADARPCDSQLLHIVVARNLEKIYGIDIAIRTCALLLEKFPGLKMSVAGSGPDRETLEKLSSDLDIQNRIHFTGRLDPEQMAELYRSADLVINPSRADNMPNSVLEALACGIPVVTTNVGGIPYMLQHGQTAWFVVPDSPQALAAGVTHVLSHPDVQRHLRTEGLALAASCGWARVKYQWLDAYQSIRISGH